MISLILLYSFSFGAGDDNWTVFITNDVPCGKDEYMGCIVPDYHFMYLNIHYLNQTDPWGNTLFQHELNHVIQPSWYHYKWILS